MAQSANQRLLSADLSIKFVIFSTGGSAILTLMGRRFKAPSAFPRKEIVDFTRPSTAARRSAEPNREKLVKQ
jgi:hypothetical protein